MKKFIRKLFTVILLAALVFTGIRFGPALYARIFGGGTVKVRLIRSGRDAVMTVTDNGPGIPREDQAHIFDRFYRVDKARSRETGGTGLGLSIVHQMVLMHGGSVSVESEEGRGSTFTVELPIHQG